MAASKTLSPAQRTERARNAAVAAHERRELIKAIAEQFAGEPLSAKTVTELRELLAGGAR